MANTIKKKIIVVGGGFSSLPGGIRYYGSGPFNNVGFTSYWWSSSENATNVAWYRSLCYDSGYADRYNILKRFGLSVRCIRD